MKDDKQRTETAQIQEVLPVAEIAAHLGPPRQPDSTNHLPRSRFIEHANLHPGTGERSRMSPPNLDSELSRELAAKTARYPTANPRATMKHLNLHKSSVCTLNKNPPPVPSKSSLERRRRSAEPTAATGSDCRR